MIVLNPMNEDEYQNYMDKMIPSYASEIAKNQNMSQVEAKTFADKQILEMLLLGLKTPNNYFYIIREENSPLNLGYLWLLVKSKDNNQSLFIADIVVDEDQRGKKIGTKAMGLIELKAKELNCKTISLHVFGHNTVARKLYSSLGYEEINVYMRKSVE